MRNLQSKSRRDLIKQQSLGPLSDAMLASLLPLSAGLLIPPVAPSVHVTAAHPQVVTSRAAQLVVNPSPWELPSSLLADGFDAAFDDIEAEAKAAKKEAARAREAVKAREAEIEARAAKDRAEKEKRDQEAAAQAAARQEAAAARAAAAAEARASRMLVAEEDRSSSAEDTDAATKRRAAKYGSVARVSRQADRIAEREAAGESAPSIFPF